MGSGKEDLKSQRHCSSSSSNEKDVINEKKRMVMTMVVREGRARDWSLRLWRKRKMTQVKKGRGTCRKGRVAEG